MSLSEFIDEDNKTFELFDVNETEQQQNGSAVDFTAVKTFYDVVQYVWLAMGIPGNILSAIVWLRLHVASKNSSAVYLAALAINDLVFLLNKFFYYVIELRRRARWPGPLLMYVKVVNEFTTTYEPLLVLGFSVKRLIAICCPLQVRGLCCIMYRLIHHVRKKSLHYFRHNVIKSWPILNFFWIGDCLHASTPSQYVTSHQFNSAFHFSGICKSNTRLQTGVKAGRFICVG